MVLTLVVSAAAVVARTGGGVNTIVQAGSARNASVNASDLEVESATTTSGAPTTAVATAPPAAGIRTSLTSRPKATTTTTSPARPAATTSTTAKASPGGVDGQGLYVVAPDGSGLRKVISGPGMHSWSPDGSKLAFADGITLRIAAADGSRQSEIAGGVEATAPAWSPDGSRIAFSRSESVWTVRSDGSGGATLVEPHGQLAGWTPDGRLIVITENPSLVVIHEKNGTRRVIASVALALVPPEVSPDGRMVAYLSHGIAVAAVDGTGSRAITPPCCGSESVFSPLAWSPDSGQVAYIHYGNVRVAAADGSGDRVLVAKATSPAWSADGRLAVIDGMTTRANGLLHSTLLVIGAAGERRLIFDAGESFSVTLPRWSPNGRLIAVGVNPIVPIGGIDPSRPALPPVSLSS